MVDVKSALAHLKAELMKFNMTMDLKKTQFVKIGEGEASENTLTIWDNNKWETVHASDVMKWLGFYLFKGVGIDVKKH